LKIPGAPGESAMSKTERPFLPMSWELGGDFMSGMVDSIRERRAREVPGREGGIEDETIEEEWPEEEWEEEDEWEDEEWEDEEWEEEEPLSVLEKLMMLIKRATVPLVEFAIDTATLVTVPAALLLLAYQTTTFGILETALLLFGATTTTLMIANAKQKLLRRLLS